MNALVRRLFARQPLEWTAPESEGPALRRALGWPALTAIGLGTMLGGIFPTIGAGAHAAGPAVILAFVLSGLVSLCVALCYAEFASMVPVAGSAYTYAYATLGEVVAWVIGWDLILEYGLSLAPVASSWSDYAQHLLADMHLTLPAWAQTAHVFSGTFHARNFFAPPYQVDVLAALTVLAVTIIVAIGIRESAGVNTALVVFQIATMIVFFAATLGHVSGVHLHPFAPQRWHGILTSTALVFFAYIGFDTVTVASEEAHQPHRNVPIGIIVALAIGTVLYVGLTAACVGVVNYTKLSDGAAMLDAVRAVNGSHPIYWIVALGGLAGNTTVMLTSLLGQTRIFYVMARDRMLPPGVARVHARFRTPARMTVLTGLIVAIFAAVFPLTDLLTLVNIGTLAAFAIVCVGVFVLRFTQPDARRPFRAPLGPVFAVLGAVSSVYLITGLSVPTWVRFGVWFVIGIAVYAAYGYRKSRLRSA